MPNIRGSQFWNDLGNGSLITGLTASGMGLANAGTFFSNNSLGIDETAALGLAGLLFNVLAKSGRGSINGLAASVLGGTATTLLAISFRYCLKLSPSAAFLYAAIGIGLAARDSVHDNEHAPQPHM